MKISELLGEQQLTPAQQIAKDAELIAQHQRQQWLKQQQQAQPPAAPTAPSPTASAPTPEQIAKHPQYNAVYQKILKQVQAQSTLPNPKIDAERAKKFTDQRIARMIQSGQ